jgi:hypothetical protein
MVDQNDVEGRIKEVLQEKKKDNSVEVGGMIYKCAVNGTVARGCMCPHVLVGGKECGYKNYCLHKEIKSQPAVSSETDRPDDSRLVWGAMHNMLPQRSGWHLRWGVVAEIFGISSYSAHLLCREFDLDPDDILQWKEEGS